MSDDKKFQQVALFIGRLRGLSVGEKATLRREIGLGFEESRVLPLFYSLLPEGVWRDDEAVYHLVATLYCASRGRESELTLPKALLKIRKPYNANGIDRRFTALLKADAYELPSRLSGLVKMLIAQKIGLDWVKLLADLLDWNHPTQRVQHDWARAYTR